MEKKFKEARENVLSTDRDVREATADHQYEFPYSREDEAQVTRRQFCNFLTLTSTALFVSASGFAAKSAYDSTKARAFDSMRVEGSEGMQPGSALNFHYPGENDTAILVRDNDGNYHAFGQKCTHLACPVYYAKEHDRLECPCHEGAFDAKTGAVLYGPPPRPLDEIEIEVSSDGQVTALGRKGGGYAG